MQGQPNLSPAVEPFVLVLRCLKSLNDGDLDEAMICLADNAEIQLIGLQPCQARLLKGKKPLRVWLKGLVDQHLLIEAEGLGTEDEVVTTVTVT